MEENQGPNSPQACFAVLANPKTDDFGKITGYRPCINMKPANDKVVMDDYSMPSQDSLTNLVLQNRGPGIVHSKVDLTGAFNRCEIKNSWTYLLEEQILENEERFLWHQNNACSFPEDNGFNM